MNFHFSRQILNSKFLDFLGNPLTCDCETLWLRNWASVEQSAVEDEPICYFPSQLSGNPLRQLRTSRFTCGARSTQIIRDACRGIPVKTPAQQHIQNGLNAGNYNHFCRPVIFRNLEITTLPSRADSADSAALGRSANFVHDPIRLIKCCL